MRQRKQQKSKENKNNNKKENKNNNKKENNKKKEEENIIEENIIEENQQDQLDSVFWLVVRPLIKAAIMILIYFVLKKLFGVLSEKGIIPTRFKTFKCPENFSKEECDNLKEMYSQAQEMNKHFKQ
ncbi:signal transducer and activator of transcription a-related [Anaeramoeba ignava]|uniref:Signal transducer and activator of transcription a-related n=1 Tax=Anaeramoeba ignava TaxID=1746090 RepID=A0A9Q0LHX1_ANAIG|nr:signal transducer and activator of transcription a-related [Anaeramoeba ignava]